MFEPKIENIDNSQYNSITSTEMTSKETIIKFIERIEEFKLNYKADDFDKYSENLKELQRASKRIKEILKTLNISTTVSQKAAGVIFDLIDISLNPVTWEEDQFGSLRIEHIEMLLQQLRVAEGYLSETGKLESDFVLNPHIDDDIKQKYLEGDYGSAVARAFKILKDEIYKKTGIEDISSAIGILKREWKSAVVEKDIVKQDFESGVSHLIHALNYFRNVDFHSRNWSVSEEKQALYFINVISMAIDLLQYYMIEKDK